MRYALNMLLIGLALLGLAACGGAPSSSEQLAPSLPTSSAQPPTAPPEPTGAPQPTRSPAAQPTTLPPQPTEVPQPAAGATIAVYHKSGGIMGLDETLTVQADGTLVLKSRDSGGEKTAQVPPADLDKLRALLASPEFAKLKPRYQANGADLFTYTVGAPGGTPASVTTMDGVDNPPVLVEVLQELSRLRQQL